MAEAQAGDDRSLDAVTEHRVHALKRLVEEGSAAGWSVPGHRLRILGVRRRADADGDGQT